jgi:hypothetical protein
MAGVGVEMLTQCLLSIGEQRFRDFELVISDHSVDYAIANFLQTVRADFPITYIRNDQKRGSSSANFNNAIRHSKGEIIKILCQDDFLLDFDALERTVEAFIDPSVQWAITPYYHSRDGVELHMLHSPELNDELLLRNTIGTHSCLSVRRSGLLEMFDEDLIWLMDCEYYYRLHRAHGNPALIRRPTMANLVWKGQVTHTSANDERRNLEIEYVKRKHFSAPVVSSVPQPAAPKDPYEAYAAQFVFSNNSKMPMDTTQQEAHAKIMEMYQRRCSLQTDINEHLPTLKKLAEECGVVVEMGVRSIVSTWAFLAGRPKQLISLDLFYPKHYLNHDPQGCDLGVVFELSQKAGVEFAFHRGDSRTFQCPRCDLLFIDTLHDYEQLAAELTLHHKACQKYIVLHDTETHWFKGEQAPEGIARAVQEFIIANDNWSIIERYTNNNGLMVLKKMF